MLQHFCPLPILRGQDFFPLITPLSTSAPSWSSSNKPVHSSCVCETRIVNRNRGPPRRLSPTRLLWFNYMEMRNARRRGARAAFNSNLLLKIRSSARQATRDAGFSSYGNSFQHLLLLLYSLMLCRLKYLQYWYSSSRCYDAHKGNEFCGHNFYTSTCFSWNIWFKLSFYVILVPTARMNLYL